MWCGKKYSLVQKFSNQVNFNKFFFADMQDSGNLKRSEMKESQN